MFDLITLFNSLAAIPPSFRSLHRPFVRTIPNPWLQRVLKPVVSQEYVSIQNVYATLHDLPAELHLEILKYAVALEQEEESRHKQPRPYAWIRITFICRYWRSLCLDYPLFWDRVYLLRADCTEEMLRRSQHVPLTLELNWTRMSSQAEKVRYRSEEAETHVPLLYDVSRVALARKVLSMKHVLPRVRQTILVDGGMPIAMNRLVDLRHEYLTLRCSPAAIDESLYNTCIKHLEIDNHESLPGGHQGVLYPWVLHKLKRNIVTLKLDIALPSHWSHICRMQEEHVWLPSLRLLSINDLGHKIIEFLITTVMDPNATRVFLDVSRGCSSNELERIACLLMIRLAWGKKSNINTNLPVCMSAGIGVPWRGYASCTYIRGWRNTRDIGRMDVDDRSEDLRIVDASIQARGLTDKMVRMLFTAQVLSIRFGEERYASACALKEAWEVRVLRLSGWSAESVKEALEGCMDTATASDSGRWSFPCMHTLVLGEPLPSALDVLEDHLREVVSLLVKRSATWGRLDVLELQFDTSVESQSLKGLERCASKVYGIGHTLLH